MRSPGDCVRFPTRPADLLTTPCFKACWTRLQPPASREHSVLRPHPSLHQSYHKRLVCHLVVRGWAVLKGVATHPLRRARHPSRRRLCLQPRARAPLLARVRPPRFVLHCIRQHSACSSCARHCLGRIGRLVPLVACCCAGDDSRFTPTHSRTCLGQGPEPLRGTPPFSDI